MKRQKGFRTWISGFMGILLTLSLAACGEKGEAATVSSQSHQEKLELIYQGSEIPPEYEAEHDGKRVNSSIYSGKVAVITVGATWCKDCQKEFPILQKLQEEFDPSEVMFLTTISVDGKKQTKEAAEEYFSKNHLTLPLYFAENSKIRKTYQVEYIPTTFVIGKDGKCVSIGTDSNGDPKYYFVESVDEEGMRKAIQKGLAQK